MNRLLSLCFFLALANPLAAQIYQWVDADGQVHYSDTWTAHAQQYSVDSGMSRPGQSNDQKGMPLAPNIISSGPYDIFRISSPTENEVLTQKFPSVSVVLMIDPPLLEGHRLELELDGMTMPASDTKFNLQGASYGSHQLSMRALNSNDAVIARSPVRHFQIRQPAEPGALQ